MGNKPRLPAPMRARANAAIRKHEGRSIPPRIDVDGNDIDAWFSSPYADEDQDAWNALLFEAFGTRSSSVVSCFVRQLAQFVRRDWDKDAAMWKPSQDEFNTVLALVGAMKPRDEAQAAFAAQLAALHLAAMRLAKRVTGEGYADERTVAVMNKTVRAYGDGLAQLQRLQGKSRTSRQSIKSETHRHVHQHVHLASDGAKGEIGGQLHGRTAPTANECASLSGPKPSGCVVSLSSRKGKASL
ncbi:hypothetical protein [Sphingomonas sp.]|uniref:hypothetical protein n=1 Tax=Sphingomonas sp. TaxID=28214 RepID=UPI0037531FBF